MKQKELANILSAAVDKWNVPGASCAVWSNDKLVTAVAGVLNSETGAPVKPDSLFQIGSINKVLTATLVMILKDRGLVDLDKPVRDYMPNFRIANLDASNIITVRQLLNHTSGMAGDFVRDTGKDPDHLEKYMEWCALLPLCHRVGEGFSYSNSAYCIAGLLVERVSGISYYEAMEKWLFKPLGLKNSVVDVAKIPWKSASSGHGPDKDDPSKMTPLDTIHTIAPSTAPAGATTMMSVENLITFARCHLNGGKSDSGKQVISAASVAEMQDMATHIPVPQRNISHWGLGWFFLAQGDSTLFGHDGGTVGQYSFLRLHKPTGTIVALLTNGGTANDCMFEVFEQTVEPLTGFQHTPPPASVSSDGVDLSKYEGRFETVATVSDFRVQDGKLMRKAVMTLGDTEMPEPEAALEYAGDDTFLNVPKTGGRPSLISFMEPDANGLPQVMFTGLRVARRVTPL